MKYLLIFLCIQYVYLYSKFQKKFGNNLQRLFELDSHVSGKMKKVSQEKPRLSRSVKKFKVQKKLSRKPKIDASKLNIDDEPNELDEDFVDQSIYKSDRIQDLHQKLLKKQFESEIDLQKIVGIEEEPELVQLAKNKIETLQLQSSGLEQCENDDDCQDEQGCFITGKGKYCLKYSNLVQLQEFCPQNQKLTFKFLIKVGIEARLSCFQICLLDIGSFCEVDQQCASEYCNRQLKLCATKTDKLQFQCSDRDFYNEQNKSSQVISEKIAKDFNKGVITDLQKEKEQEQIKQLKKDNKFKLDASNKIDEIINEQKKIKREIGQLPYQSGSKKPDPIFKDATKKLLEDDGKENEDSKIEYEDGDDLINQVDSESLIKEKKKIDDGQPDVDEDQLSLIVEGEDLQKAVKHEIDDLNNEKKKISKQIEELEVTSNLVSVMTQKAIDQANQEKEKQADKLASKIQESASLFIDGKITEDQLIDNTKPSLRNKNKVQKKISSSSKVNKLLIKLLKKRILNLRNK